jgi:hypothetical protein
VPNIAVHAMDKLWNHVDDIIQDVSVLYKKLSVENVSFFVNQGDKFRSINAILKNTKLSP